MILLCCLQTQAQEKTFYQSITQKVNYIKTNKNAQNIFFYIDSTLEEDYIKVLNIEKTRQVAKMVDDTLILLENVCENKDLYPIINVYLRNFPKEIDVEKNSNVVLSVLRKISIDEFIINADRNSSLSFCAVYDCVFDSLIINQKSKSDIYFSKLAINKSFYLKADNAVFQANDSEIKDNIRQTILSYKSLIKIKGYTLNKHR